MNFIVFEYLAAYGPFGMFSPVLPLVWILGRSSQAVEDDLDYPPSRFQADRVVVGIEQFQSEVAIKSWIDPSSILHE